MGRPDYLRVDQVGPGSTYVLYFDGTSGWEILPGAASIAKLAGGEPAFAQKYARDFRLNTWIADRDAHDRITSPPPNVVRISDGDINHQLDITLDAVSSLPVKTTSISLADPAHPVSSDEVTTEWETVQGIRQYSLRLEAVGRAVIACVKKSFSAPLTIDPLVGVP